MDGLLCICLTVASAFHSTARQPNQANAQAYFLVRRCTVRLWTLEIIALPLDVQVVSVVTGTIGTNIMTRNEDSLKLPDKSFYCAAQSEVGKRAEGREELTITTPEKYARKVVTDVLGGANGVTYRGKLATIASLKSAYMPT